jgi:hypothetical protein
LSGGLYARLNHHTFQQPRIHQMIGSCGVETASFAIGYANSRSLTSATTIRRGVANRIALRHKGALS